MNNTAVKLNKITVIGHGAWAMTMANHVAAKVNEVSVYCYSKQATIKLQQSYTHDKLPAIPLNKNIQFTHQINESLANSEAIIFCVPARFIAQTVEKILPFYTPNIPFLNLSKGIISADYLLLHDYFKSKFKSLNYAVLSGPNLALEIAQKKPAAAVIAAENSQTVSLFQSIINHSNLRIYSSDDIVGVSCGGVIKNSIAIAAGCIDTLSLGVNSKASLITRSLVEMIEFGASLGAKPKTFYGLSGIGDLIATCNSPLSRNYQCGVALAQGQTIEQFESNLNAIAEGIQTTQLLYNYSKKQNMALPIIEGVYNIMFKQHKIESVIEQLMQREVKRE